MFTYCRQESALFSPHIHATWEVPFSAALYIKQGSYHPRLTATMRCNRITLPSFLKLICAAKFHGEKRGEGTRRFSSEIGETVGYFPTIKFLLRIPNRCRIYLSTFPDVGGCTLVKQFFCIISTAGKRKLNAVSIDNN